MNDQIDDHDASTPLTNVILRENQDDGLLEQMEKDFRNAVDGLMTSLSTSGSRFLKGKADQEVAKAQEVLSQILERVARLKLDSRDQAHRHRLECAAFEADEKRKNMAAYYEGLSKAVEAAQKLSELGVPFQIEAILAPLQSIAPSPSPKIEKRLPDVDIAS